jgi:hypothetical protein
MRRLSKPVAQGNACYALELTFVPVGRVPAKGNILIQLHQPLAEHSLDDVALVIQGVLVGDRLEEAGLSAQVRVAQAETAA